jgi:hypothetical protein
VIGGDIRLEALALETLPRNGDRHLLSCSGHSDKFATTFVLLAKATISTDAFFVADSFNSRIFVHFCRTWVCGRAYSSQEVWQDSFSSGFHWIPTIFVAFAYLTTDVALLGKVIIAGNCILPPLWPNAPAIRMNPWFLLYCSCFLLVIPSIFAKHMQDWTIVGWINRFCFFLTLVSILFY